MSYRSPSMDSFSEPDLRVSDAERERVVTTLRDHAAEGRLEPAELEERVAAALAARTQSELRSLLADMPQPAPPRPRARRAAWRLPALRSPLVMVGVLLVAIWAFTGAGYFWPVWPLIGLGFFALKGGCGGRSRHACRRSQRTDAVWL
jgi:hypothetical protein